MDRPANAAGFATGFLTAGGANDVAAGRYMTLKP